MRIRQPRDFGVDGKLTVGSDINDAGVIVGSAMKSGVEHGFMLVPKFCALPRR